MSSLFGKPSVNSSATPPPLPPPAPVQGTSGLSSFLDSFKGQVPIALMILVAVILIVVVIVFIIYQYKKGSLKMVCLLKQPVIPANPMVGDHYIASAGKLPSLDNSGGEFSYSIWLFLDNLNITEDHKIVMYRGNPSTYNNGSFFVYMDSKTNKLYASLRTDGVVSESMSADPKLSEIASNKGFVMSTIDYIPLQRWVNITYSVKDTTFSTFLDGDLYSVTSIYELPTKSDGTRVIISPQSGDIMLGGKLGKEGFNGYIGSAYFANYTITLHQAKVLYMKGPYKSSWLSMFGLGNYGIRAPVYRLNADAELTK